MKFFQSKMKVKIHKKKSELSMHNILFDIVYVFSGFSFIKKHF